MNRAILSGAKVFVCLSLGGLLLAGCGGRRSQQPVPCEGENCGVEGDMQGFCVRDDECADDHFCQGGACVPREGNRPDDPCVRHQDCPVSMFCNVATGFCAECLNDDHCDYPLYCLPDGTCGETMTGCTSNFDCNGLVCNSDTGDCVQCMSSGDCPLGQTCRDFQCYTDGGNPECISQADCDQYGRICDLAEGRCVPCLDDLECGFGRMCSGGVCVDETTDPVDPNNPTGGMCLTRDDCGGQACFLFSCMPCFGDFMCNDLLSFEPAICDGGNCITPNCSSAYDCAPGEACYSGHCGACLYDEECRTGEVCDPATGVCGTGTTPPDCTSNADCTGGQVCNGSTCANCTSSTQCDAGMVCGTDGRCTGGSPDCSANSDCTGGQVCHGGACTDCTDSSQCDTGLVCTNDRCVPPPGTGDLGTPCSENTECAPGYVCLSGASGGICSRTCIQSGAGGDADCPIGYGCINYESGALDGLLMCDSAGQLAASYPGQPFDMPPGASCSAYNGCQTSVCYGDTEVCATGCVANRDCAAGDVCWAVTNRYGDMLGYHFCAESDTSEYTVAGGSCSNNTQCDSGLCVGTCSDNGNPCNDSSPCGLFGSCQGTCRDHCRSNADCPAGDACNPWPLDTWNGTGFVPTCTPKFFNGTQADATSCTSHDQCSSDWCVGSICTSPCAISADCTDELAGKVCTPRSFNNTSGEPFYSMAFCL